MREGITPPGMAHYRAYRFTPAIRAGGLLHLSGQLGLVSLTPPELAQGAAGQIAAAFDLQAQVLKEAGRGWEAVVEIMSFHVAGPEGGLPQQMPLMMAALGERFAEPCPAWTAVEVAGLALPGALVEIRMVALA
ncbi:Rid family hydrolase [Albimonas pacifica]|uniref:Enamine deaminase RidA, house cleaning of reactive enamine intermediates, YjgF/YER057c/UK114 family n=1 Tax=Albimonas pacifica TaxID=1114924 RepID=A0A1I3C692_9RHOB|nr:Rid family hydrolase [Albimonas pacifica]SFH69521.1 Enamine deaminase RidA, house cleaning of reactive enamine intermediates, YjgF/YER057c/UK114 family [Albimonas pacifica]